MATSCAGEMLGSIMAELSARILTALAMWIEIGRAMTWRLRGDQLRRG